MKSHQRRVCSFISHVSQSTSSIGLSLILMSGFVQAQHNSEMQHQLGNAVTPPITALSGLPDAPPCFKLTQFTLAVPEELTQSIKLVGTSQLPNDPFRFAQDYLEKYHGVCVGISGINLIAAQLTGLILQRGYSTTRVGIPEQDLSSGLLKVTLVPGLIHSIRVKDITQLDSHPIGLNAFPAKPSQLLNLRDLEQGVEQLKRVPGRQVDMQIIPSDAVGESDVVLTVTQTRPWRLTATLDDSGAKRTGKLQAGLNLSIDNPLGLSDVLNIGIQQNAENQLGQSSTAGNSLSYSLPFGYWTYSLSANKYDYSHHIAGVNQSLVSSGTSSTLQLKLDRLVQRDQSQRNSVQVSLGKRWSHAFINDAELAIQQRNTTFVELGWVHKHYIGRAQLDLTLANRWGNTAFNGMDNPGWYQPGDPTFLYTMQSIDATLAAPVTLRSHPATYIATLRGQTSKSPLYINDHFSMGDRNSVRGFDGERPLTAERGFFLRNEIELPVGKQGTSMYVGLDIGKVYGPSVAQYGGDKLAGTIIGMRGAYKRGTYHFFSSWALSGPDYMKSPSPLLGFNFSYQY